MHDKNKGKTLPLLQVCELGEVAEEKVPGTLERPNGARKPRFRNTDSSLRIRGKWRALVPSPWRLPSHCPTPLA